VARGVCDEAIYALAFLWVTETPMMHIARV